MMLRTILRSLQQPLLQVKLAIKLEKESFFFCKFITLGTLPGFEPGPPAY